MSKIDASATGVHSQYETKLVTFLDILGFREHLDDPLGPAPLRHMLTTFRSALTESLPDARVIAISDSVVVAANCASFTALINHLTELSKAIGSLSASGVFVRGGISLGDFSFQDDILVSPALSAAYQLESKRAAYPRVILDPEITRKHVTQLWFEEFGADAAIFGNSRSEVNKVAPVDFDGYRYLDCFAQFIENISLKGNQDYATNRAIERIKHLRLIILVNLQERSAHIKSKYVWLGQYFNRVVGRLEPNKKMARQMLIPVESLEVGVNTHIGISSTAHPVSKYMQDYERRKKASRSREE